MLVGFCNFADYGWNIYEASANLRPMVMSALTTYDGNLFHRTTVWGKYEYLIQSTVVERIWKAKWCWCRDCLLSGCKYCPGSTPTC